MDTLQIAREGWIALGDSYLQRRRVYHQLAWPCANDENKFVPARLISVSPSGAFIASARNESHPIMVVADFSSHDTSIDIYSASGDLLLSIPWDREPASIIALGWTFEESLAVALDDASVRIYSLSGDCIVFELGEEPRKIGIKSCRITPYAIAICSRIGNFFVVSDWSAPFPKIYPRISALNNLKTFWNLLEHSGSSSGSPELIISDEKSLYIVSEDSIDTFQYADIKCIFVSPSANFWACVLNTAILQIRIANSPESEASCNLASCFELNEISSLQFCWCAEDAVLACSQETLLILHVSGERYVTELFNPIVLSHTDGGCFLLSAKDLSFISPVNYASSAIFQVASRHPGAVLLRTYTNSCLKSPLAAELLESLLDGSEVENGVKTCIDAALSSWDVVLQKTLLLAAQLGRLWVESDEDIRDRIVVACRTLRILNNVRHRDLGLPLSISRYNIIGESGVLRLLVTARKHKQAYNMAVELNMSKRLVVNDWAKFYLKLSMPGSSSRNSLIMNGSTIPADHVCDVDWLAETADRRLNGDSKLDYAELARAAVASGQIELAVQLLEHESESVRQVPLLLELKMYEKALRKALRSYDTDLIMLVLVFLRKSLKLADFFSIIKSARGGAGYLELYARRQEPDLLRDIYFLEDRHIDMGQLAIEDFLHLIPLKNDLYSSKDKKLTINSEKVPDDAQIVVESVFSASESRGKGQKNSSKSTDDYLIDKSMTPGAISEMDTTTTKKLEYIREAATSFQNSPINSNAHLLARESEKILIEQCSLNNIVSLSKNIPAIFVPGEPLLTTIERLLILQKYKHAVKIANKFNFPVKLLTWTVLRVCSNMKHWILLEQHVMHNINNSIGWIPANSGSNNGLGVSTFAIIDEILKHKNSSKEISAKFISFCDPKERGLLFLRTGAIRDAARACFHASDINSLRLVRQSAESRVDIEIANGFIAQLEDVVGTK